MCVDQTDFFCSSLEGLSEQYQEKCRNTVMELWWDVGIVGSKMELLKYSCCGLFERVL